MTTVISMYESFLFRVSKSSCWTNYNHLILQNYCSHFLHIQSKFGVQELVQIQHGNHFELPKCVVNLDKFSPQQSWHGYGLTLLKVQIKWKSNVRMSGCVYNPLMYESNRIEDKEKKVKIRYMWDLGSRET